MAEFKHFSHDHPLILHGEKDLVPTDWHSCLCNGCGFPIFSTPSYTCSKECNFFLHKNCAHPPDTLKHSKHEHPLTLATEPYQLSDSSRSCANCGREPHNFIYVSRDLLPSSEFFLHLSCALPLGITVLHQSHAHELIPLRGECLFVCGACGEKHEGLSYFCNLCGYWIHRDCASLPNTIRYENHRGGRHILCRTYTFPYDEGQQYLCGICEKPITKGVEIYFCSICPSGDDQYYVHLKCATANTELYHPVSSRDIESHPEVARLPMKDESANLISYLLEFFGRSSEFRHEDGSGLNLFEDRHDHPLTFHGPSDDDCHPDLSLVCDLCIEPIFLPYYSCSECPNFFLHSYCAKAAIFSETITHPACKPQQLVPLKRPPSSSNIIPYFECNCCRRPCNGLAYGCLESQFFLDMVCVLLPGAATHEAHGRSHILALQYSEDNTGYSKCCAIRRSWTYKCAICHDNYQIHADCSLLPATVRHKYDKHPLRLVTSSDERYDPQHFCEICEQSIHESDLHLITHWYYRCDECDQSFHTRCIPSVSPKHSKIKFGNTIHISSCHPCPLTSVRMLTIPSRICGRCPEMIQGLEDSIAFQCSKCSFMIHYDCAEKLSKNE